jgi:hypothetical protein
MSVGSEDAGTVSGADELEYWAFCIITPPRILAPAARALRAHHCRVDEYETHCEIFFPMGTTRQEVFPRTVLSERYDVTLPDGYSILEMYMLPRQKSLIYYPPEELETR